MMHDCDIREAMWHHIRLTWEGVHDGHDPGKSLFTNEFQVSDYCRADIAIISPTMMEGFELKSSADSLKRLPRQIHEYSLVFDRCSLVLAPNKTKAADMAPAWWGIYHAVPDDGSGWRIVMVREPAPNPHTSPLDTAFLVWRDEALDILERKHADKGYRSKPRMFLYDRMVEVMEPAELASEVRSALLARRYWRDSQWVEGGTGEAAGNQWRSPMPGIIGRS